MARFYVDTSAYLAFLLGEDGADTVALTLADGQLLSSVLLVLEASRNLIRLSREGCLAHDEAHAALQRLGEDVEHFVLRDLTLDLCSGTLLPALTTPRSLDLAHLRTALWFHRQSPITRFVSLDERQIQAARELDLPVA
jgi:predicted nucleic acid-binding protein